MLTAAEKAAATSFWAEKQDDLNAANRDEPPKLHPHVLIHHVRHECGTGRSVSFEMREHYETSPDYIVHVSRETGRACGVVICRDGLGEGTDWAQDLPEDHAEWFESVHVPAGRFAWVYRQGRCADCGTTGRSKEGRLVDTLIREPAGRS